MIKKIGSEQIGFWGLTVSTPQSMLLTLSYIQ